MNAWCGIRNVGVILLVATLSLHADSADQATTTLMVESVAGTPGDFVARVEMRNPTTGELESRGSSALRAGGRCEIRLQADAHRWLVIGVVLASDGSRASYITDVYVDGKRVSRTRQSVPVNRSTK